MPGLRRAPRWSARYLCPLRHGVHRGGLAEIGRGHWLAAWWSAALALALGACLGYALLARACERVAVPVTAAWTGLTVAWAWRGLVLTAEGEPAWVVICIAAGLAAWGLTRLARLAHRLLLS